MRRLLLVPAVLALLAMACGDRSETRQPAAPAGPVTPPPAGSVRLQWFGHSMFLLTAPDGTTVLTDPYEEIGYGQPDVGRVDVVTVSHDHFDHDNVDLAEGPPEVIRGLADEDWAQVDRTVGMVRLTTVPTYHDAGEGEDRGRNAMFLFEVGGLRLLHAGDLGHTLSPEQVRAAGRVDVLLVPVGGHFTIDAEAAAEVVAQLRPRVVIPMHYLTEGLDPDRFPIAGVEPFLEGKPVRREGNVVVLSEDDLPGETTVVVMDFR